MLYSFVVFICLVIALAYGAERDYSTYTFKTYLREFGKTYGSNEEYARRELIFLREVEEIVRHNADKSQTWTKGINHMSDWTMEEFRGLLGYHKGLGFSRREALENERKNEPREEVDISGIPAQVDWRDIGAVTPVKDQGHCGSCWTFASAQCIESAWFQATGHLTELSQQQIAGCTPNPTHCGGQGGCEGGISQLAFEGVKAAGGLATEWTYPYISYFGTDFDCVFNATKMVVGAKVKDHVQVLSNDYSSLMAAIATTPVAISVDASLFKNYEKGVFNSCDMENPDINHAVQLVGYGSDSFFGDYYLVRNSWGPLYGENGYIRIARQASGQQICGVDKTPQDGSGCDDGPTEVTVCGMCGILYDNTYPVVDFS
jgi:cathepsin L